VSVLTKWAKYGVLAMIVADAVGIMVVHNRLTQPVANVPSLADDMPIAMAETPLILAKDALPKDTPATENLQVTDTVAQMDIPSMPAVSRIDPLPAPMAIEPLAIDTPQASPRVARQMQAALRAPVIPTVRIAELRPVRKSTRNFTTAFTNDISSTTRVSNAEADVDYSMVRAARDSAQQSGVAYDANRLDSSPSPTESVEAPVESQSAVPVPEFGGKNEAQQLQLDLPAPAAPAAPVSAAPSSDEIPAS
jgi:hypothetical protein